MKNGTTIVFLVKTIFFGELIGVYTLVQVYTLYNITYALSINTVKNSKNSNIQHIFVSFHDEYALLQSFQQTYKCKLTN